MATHPSGVPADIIGIEASNHGRSCEEHDVCGSVLANKQHCYKTMEASGHP